MNASAATLILLLSVGLSSASITMIQYSYAQGLDKSYANTNCGLSIQYPSNWNFEERTHDDGSVINWIVELQPNNEDGYNNVVSIELNDISSLSDKSFEAIKDFEEESLSDISEIVKMETSEPTQISGYPAQKIVQSELVSGDKKMEVFTVAFDREYKITYDATSSYYSRYLPIFEEMIKTFKITQPSFEGIIC